MENLQFEGCPNETSGLFPLNNNGMGMQVGADSSGYGAGSEQYSQLIGKPLVSRGENLVESEEEALRRKRAKKANEIFRSVSQSAGLEAFFFDKFLVWSDYVEGKLGDEEFTQRVREEVSRKAKPLEN